jgi:hypothetical protein
MATLRAAQSARKRHAVALTKLGAHAIAVEGVSTKSGRKKFVVVAFFKSKPSDAPESLEVRQGGKRINVPLVIKVAPPFKIESLPGGDT